MAIVQYDGPDWKINGLSTITGKLILVGLVVYAVQFWPGLFNTMFWGSKVSWVLFGLMALGFVFSALRWRFSGNYESVELPGRGFRKRRSIAMTDITHAWVKNTLIGGELCLRLESGEHINTSIHGALGQRKQLEQLRDRINQSKGLAPGHPASETLLAGETSQNDDSSNLDKVLARLQERAPKELD